ncbi:hypothetical protein HUS23_14240 [Ectothiorhodospiraceae bacterium 2226]|nr:hypothetical protein HUS23_14240 [Ectothiorhodospiraceae bacterium 2226]
MKPITTIPCIILLIATLVACGADALDPAEGQECHMLSNDVFHLYRDEMLPVIELVSDEQGYMEFTSTYLSRIEDLQERSKTCAFQAAGAEAKLFAETYIFLEQMRAHLVAGRVSSAKGRIHLSANIAFARQTLVDGVKELMEKDP